jgi:hypothetical protein
MTRSGACGDRLAVVLALAAWLWPASFYVNYFRAIEERGGMSHVAFHTCDVDPKLTALEFVRSRITDGRPVDVVCREWWSYWPLEYFAHGAADVRVLTWDEWRETDFADRAEQTWFVECGGGDPAHEAWRVAHGSSAKRHAVIDYGFRPAIWVIGPVEKFSQNY